MAQRARVPAEWEPHRATWLAWPSHRDLWLEDLAPARAEFVGLCRGIVGQAAQPPRREPSGRALASRAGAAHSSDRAVAETLEILVLDDAGEREASAALVGLRVRFHRQPFGDIWLRDTAPVFKVGTDGALLAVRFRFNGWGGKYELEGDQDLAERVADAAAAEVCAVDLTLEGGGLEIDGEGTCLTTRQCALNLNRNPGLNEAEVTRSICEALGVERVVWLERGLMNDHTDGHIDTLARFVAPGVVVCMEAREHDDPNREVLAAIVSRLGASIDARQRRLDVVTVPSPGTIVGRDGNVMPASYLNYYISNSSVLVPTYGCAYDDEAVAVLTRCFPDHVVVGLPARAILSGGGAFHCITQQEPLVGTPRAS